MSKGKHKPSRRDFMGASLAGGLGLTLGASGEVKSSQDDAPVSIGSRRELFVDRALVAGMEGAMSLRLHEPTTREMVLHHDEAWEGTGSGYHSIFQDGDRYRMYYKAWHLDVKEGSVNTNRHPLYCCYAESKDGIHWEKPRLGLHEFQGSKDNNIVMTSGELGPLHVDAGHPAVFKDENRDAPDDAKYKAIFRSVKPNGLLPFKSADGLDWKPMTDGPILHGLGAFDSQNLAFWDPNIGQYRAYWRIFTEGVTTDEEWKPGGYRAIRTATSDDLVHWGPHTDLSYEDSPNEQLYTNQIKPYHRAPHLLLGFPSRYIDRGWSPSMEALPALAERKMRSSGSERYGTAITDSLFMASRDGTHFKRWNEAFLRPGIERPEVWHYGQQYLGWHLIETESALPGAAKELSLYGVESYWHGPGSKVRRYTLRLDGFVSAHASAAGGALLSKAIQFEGDALYLNFATSAAGDVRVEIQDLGGKALPGFSAEDCYPLFGDSTERMVQWKDSPDLGALSGRPVRVRFFLRDADLFAYQFKDMIA